MSFSAPTKNPARHDSFSVTSDKELLLASDFPYELHPTQTLAFESWAAEILYGGAKGGGKSFLMRFASVMWCLNCPGLQVYLFRREFPELWKNHMEGPCSYPMILGKLMQKNFCSIVGKEIRWWNGARIFLNHLQHEKHVTKYQGVEIHALLIDELTQFSEASYRSLRSSVRLGSWNPRQESKAYSQKFSAAPIQEAFPTRSSNKRSSISALIESGGCRKRKVECSVNLSRPALRIIRRYLGMTPITSIASKD